MSPSFLGLLRRLGTVRASSRNVAWLGGLALGAFMLVAFLLFAPLADELLPPALQRIDPGRPSLVAAAVTELVLQGSKQFDSQGNELWNFPDRLLPNERYLIAGHHSGWTNQVMCTVHAIFLALLTRRTPIIPYYVGLPGRLGPLVHKHLPNMAFQEIFDLPRFFDALRQTPLGRDLRGLIDVQEVMEINRATEHGGRGWPEAHSQVTPGHRQGETDALDETVKLDEVETAALLGVDRQAMTWQVGCWEAHRGRAARTSLNLFRLDPQYTRLPPSALQRGEQICPVYSGMQPLLAAYPADGVVDAALAAVPDKQKSALRPNEWVTCASADCRPPFTLEIIVRSSQDSLFYASTSAKEGVWPTWLTPPHPGNLTALEGPEVGPGAPGPWEMVAQHMHWRPELFERAQGVARRLLGVEHNAELPPFISVHIRHGDFLGKYCQDQKTSCFSVGAFAHEVAGLRARLLAEKGLDAKDVIFTTNERDPAFLEETRLLGWKRITVDEELRLRHDYGDWYPMLIDNVLLSMGAAIVGTEQSTMSMINARRVEYWNDGLVAYVSLPGQP